MLLKKPVPLSLQLIAEDNLALTCHRYNGHLYNFTKGIDLDTQFFLFLIPDNGLK